MLQLTKMFNPNEKPFSKKRLRNTLNNDNVF